MCALRAVSYCYLSASLFKSAEKWVELQPSISGSYSYSSSTSLFAYPTMKPSPISALPSLAATATLRLSMFLGANRRRWILRPGWTDPFLRPICPWGHKFRVVRVWRWALNQVGCGRFCWVLLRSRLRWERGCRWNRWSLPPLPDRGRPGIAVLLSVWFSFLSIINTLAFEVKIKVQSANKKKMKNVYLNNHR